MKLTSILTVASFFTATLSFSGEAKAVSLEESTIPVLDMNDYYKEETRPRFYKKLSQALQDIGFFAVINTGVSSEILDHAYDSAKRFFEMENEIKLKYDAAAKNYQRGYQPFYCEKAKNHKIGDYKEFLHIGRYLNPEQQARLGYHENIWPDEFDLETPIMTLYSELEKYMVPIQRAIAESINLPSDVFNDYTVEGDCMLRVSHYPVSEKAFEKGAVWAASHTDIDLLTILPRASSRGLEVLDKEGNWIRVIVPEDAFIVNGGDMLENMTNGYFRSAVHRVVCREDNKREDRYSMVLFIHPRYNDNIKPLPQCIEMTGGKQKYAEGTRQEFLSERLADLHYASYEMLKDLAESQFVERLMDYGRESLDCMKNLQRNNLASEKVLSRILELENQQ